LKTKKLILVNYYSAGADGRGHATFSSGISSFSFKGNLDFNDIRKYLKKSALNVIESGSACVNFINFFVEVLFIKDSEVVKCKKFKIPLLNVLKWK
jgi:hypothetical protein